MRYNIKCIYFEINLYNNLKIFLNCINTYISYIIINVYYINSSYIIYINEIWYIFVYSSISDDTRVCYIS